MLTVSVNEYELKALINNLIKERLVELLGVQVQEAKHIIQRGPEPLPPSTVVKQKISSWDTPLEVYEKQKVDLRSVIPGKRMPNRKRAARPRHKYLNQQDRREVVWLLNNTKYSKSDIARHYGVSDKTITDKSLYGYKVWEDAVDNPTRPDWVPVYTPEPEKEECESPL